MLGIFHTNNALDTKAALDAIEKEVYIRLKPLGFRRHGRTLHRFVSDHISQVVNFQTHGGRVCVNIGIRIPECAERTFTPIVDRNYYREEECTLRSRLGSVSGRKETWFNLQKNHKKISAQILKELEQEVLPAFERLNSREKILLLRKQYPQFDTMYNHLIELDEAMIYGYMGCLDKAEEKFRAYYKKQLAEHQNPNRYVNVFLKRGESVLFWNQKITARQNGYVKIRENNAGHISYLENLAADLGISLQ